MRKPFIGIVPLVDSERESYWMLPGYMKGIEEAGGIPVMLPLTSDRKVLEQMVNTFDGFLFSGGHDVDPSVYDETPTEQCAQCCPDRDAMEIILLQMVLEKDKPALGICRGLQFINAVLGGKLYQDLPTEHPSDILHRQPAPYDRPIHNVSLIKGTPLYNLLEKETLPVNSCHHQAVKTLAPDLQAMAYSEDGLVEAACMPDKRFVWAVQWHPEFSYQSSEDSRNILKAFVSAGCREE